MKLFDTHCHFETTDKNIIRTILRRARNAGVEALIAVGGSNALNVAAIAALDVAQEDAALPRVAVALGYDREQLHVCSSEVDVPSSFALVAAGEIGLDYHYSPETRERQIALFRQQLLRARERDLPVVIHTREADEDTLLLLREIPSRGVIHCYTGSVEAARQYLDLGFYISISGIVTFRAAENVREVARMIPTDRLLIETDSPFLAPVPMRGKPNEPAFIQHTCAFLANLIGVSADDLAEITFSNAVSIFGSFGTREHAQV